ncbi:MAG: hypothetical protein E7005_01000 [Alphaproteobacteria bacterium]|nr:hypothetical protein [Alphaproteobacteria bacterium]
MYFDVMPSVSYNKDYRLERIQCYPNGAFTLELKDKSGKRKLKLFDVFGKEKQGEFEAKKAVLLFNRNYILQEEPAKNNFANNEIVFRGTNPTGTLYAYDGTILAEGFEDFEVTPYWLILTYKENKQLIRIKDNVVVAEKFTKCKTFHNGYALTQDSPLYQTSNWDIFDDRGQYLATIPNIHDFIGDRLFLIHSKTEPNCYTLIDVEQNELATNIVGFKKFNFSLQHFSLTFFSGGTAFYSPEGKRLSTIAGKNVDFLPDGTFIFNDGLHPIMRYSSSGLMIKEDVYRYEQISSYYLLIKGMVSELYNRHGKKIEENCLIADKRGDFVLFQKEYKYHLYNAIEKVFEFDII